MQFNQIQIPVGTQHSRRRTAAAQQDHRVFHARCMPLYPIGHVAAALHRHVRCQMPTAAARLTIFASAAWLAGWGRQSRGSRPRCESGAHQGALPGLSTPPSARPQLPPARHSRRTRAWQEHPAPSHARVPAAAGRYNEDLQFAVLMWLEDAFHPDLVDCKAAVVACPAAVRLLASALGHPTQPLNRLLALSTMERLAGSSCTGGPLYPHIPTAARIAVDPGPARRGHVPATHSLPGSDIQLAMHTHPGPQLPHKHARL